MLERLLNPTCFSYSTLITHPFSVHTLLVNAQKKRKNQGTKKNGNIQQRNYSAGSFSIVTWIENSIFQIQ